MGREEARQVLLREKEKWDAKGYEEIGRMDWKEPFSYEVHDNGRTCYIQVHVLERDDGYIHLAIPAADNEMSGFYSLTQSVVFEKESADE